MSDPDPEPASTSSPGSGPGSPDAGRHKWVVFVIVAVLSLVADQASKIWARDLKTLRFDHSDAVCIVPDDMMVRRDASGVEHPPICHGANLPVIESVWHWRLSMNPGSAFGLFSSTGGARIGLSVVGIVAVFGMLWMLRKSRSDQKVLHWALALVTGGAIGNLIDRILYGVVTDFILWHAGPYDPVRQRWEWEWPVFNVADIVLVVGVILMFLDIQKEGRRDKARKASRQARAKAAGLVKTFEGK